MKDIQGFAFFDLDGTLLNAKSEIEQEVATAMESLIQNRVIPVIATGRSNIELAKIKQDAGISSAITMNGQYVEFESKEVYSQTIDATICERLLTMAKERGDALGFYNPQSIYISHRNKMIDQCYNFINSPLPPVDANLYLNQQVNMMLVFCDEGDQDYHKAFPDLTFYRNGPFAIDTISRNGSKGHGVKALKKALNLEHVPTFAFGDGTNDLDLFRACDVSVAMGNACDSLKEIATHITTENTNHGIVNGLKKLQLI